MLTQAASSCFTPARARCAPAFIHSPSTQQTQPTCAHPREDTDAVCELKWCWQTELVFVIDNIRDVGKTTKIGNVILGNLFHIYKRAQYCRCWQTNARAAAHAAEINGLTDLRCGWREREPTPLQKQNRRSAKMEHILDGKPKPCQIETRSIFPCIIPAPRQPFHYKPDPHTR